MKKITHLIKSVRILPLLMASIVILSLVPSRLAFADANKLYLTPSSSQMNLNTIFTINVRSYADSDQSVGNAIGSVTYPTNQLKVTGISISGSGYSPPTITQSSGTIGFSATRNPAPSGTAQIFAITFQAVGEGTAIVGFTNTSKVNNASTTYSSGSYTITNPNPTITTPKPPVTTSTPKPTPVAISSAASPTPTPATNTNSAEEIPQPTPDPTGLIDSVSVDPLYASSTITWNVQSASATSTLSYGENSSKMDKAAKVTKNPDGMYTATIDNLSPGIRYFFTISASAPGGKNGTYSGVVPTRGFPVTITMTENKNPVDSGQIKIGNQSSPIPSGGKVTLGLAAGSYNGTINTDTASLSINLTVTAKNVPIDGTAPEAQSYSFNLTSSPLEQGPGSDFSILGFIGILIGGTVVLGLGFAGFILYRRRQFNHSDGASPYTESSTVIIDDGYSWQSQSKHSEHDSGVQPAQQIATHETRHNSVYIAEEQPLDMFETANQRTTEDKASSNDSSETPRSPN